MSAKPNKTDSARPKSKYHQNLAECRDLLTSFDSLKVEMALPLLKALMGYSIQRRAADPDQLKAVKLKNATLDAIDGLIKYTCEIFNTNRTDLFDNSRRLVRCIILKQAICYIISRRFGLSASQIGELVNHPARMSKESVRCCIKRFADYMDCEDVKAVNVYNKIIGYLK